MYLTTRQGKFLRHIQNMSRDDVGNIKAAVIQANSVTDAVRRAGEIDKKLKTPARFLRQILYNEYKRLDETLEVAFKILDPKEGGDEEFRSKVLPLINA